MKKVKCIFESILYLAIIFLSQKIIYYIYSFIIFYLAAKPNTLVSKQFVDDTPVEEMALMFIDRTESLYIFLGWLIGLSIIFIALKLAKQKPFMNLSSKIRYFNTIMCIVIGFGMVFLTNGTVNSVNEYYSINSFFGVDFEGMYTLGLAQSLIFIGVLMPIFEEILFRGLIMGQLLKLGSKWIGIITQSLLFAFSHFSLIQGFYVFLLGLITGYAVTKTKSIKSGIVIHIIFNVANIYLYNRNNSYYNMGQLIVFIVIGLILTLFGIDQLRVNNSITYKN